MRTTSVAVVGGPIEVTASFTDASGCGLDAAYELCGRWQSGAEFAARLAGLLAGDWGRFYPDALASLRIEIIRR